MLRPLVSRSSRHTLRSQQGAQRVTQPGAGSLARLHVLAARAATEEFKSMRLNFEARAPGRLGGDGVNAAVIDLGDCATRDADEVVVV
jgi:hypothetical protein